MTGNWDPKKRQAWLDRTRGERTAYDRRWRKANPDKARRTSREYRRRLAALHPDVVAARRHRDYWRNPHGMREKSRRANERARARLLELLGPFCGFCGETDDAVLQVDHRIPVGTRRHGGCAALWRRLRTGRDSPHNLQVLCANDHARKTRTEVELCRATRVVPEAKARIRVVKQTVAA